MYVGCETKASDVKEMTKTRALVVENTTREVLEIYAKKKLSSTDLLLLENLNKVIEIEKSFIYKDNNGLPNHFNKTTNTMMPVSKSHHGRFEVCVAINYDSK